MSTARTFLRFAVAGLFVNVLALACVVEDNGGDDDDNTPCDAGTYRDCTCPDDTASQQKCNASGSGYAACVCDGSSAGGSGNSAGEGNTPTAGTAGTAGSSNNYGGETGEGGAPNQTGGAPANNAGAGGAGEVDGGLCAEDPNDSCADCYQQGCCDEWTACVDDDTCLTEFTNIIACTEVIKAERNVLPADLQTCAEDEGAAAGPWSQGVSALTVDIVNCVGGKDGNVGWESMPWGGLSCKAGCFDK